MQQVNKAIKKEIKYNLFVMFCLLIFVGCSSYRDKNAWQKAAEENTIVAYEQYLTSHPQGEFAKNAHDRIENLIFQKATKKNTIVAYEQYLASHPQGKFTERAHLRIENLIFQKATEENTIIAYERYLASHPNGKFAEKAHSLILDQIIIGLKDGDSDIRKKAAVAMREFGNASAVSLILEQLIIELKDGDSNVRKKAAVAMGEFGDARAVSPLITALKDENNDVRRSAAEALGEINDPGTIEPLISALKDKSRDGVTAALRAKGRQVLEPLLVLLKDEDTQMRYNVTQLLSGIVRRGDDSALKPLIDIVNDKKERYWYSRGYAAKALGRIGDPRAVESLINALKDKNERDENDVRGYAAEALGRIGDSRAVEPLIAISLRDEDSWGTVQYCAKRALEEFESQGKLTVKSLVKYITYWYSSPYVTGALKRKGWKPQTGKDRIHFYVGQRNGEEIKKNWSVTKRVLLEDVGSTDYYTIENALFAFIGIGKEEIIPALVSKLNVKGNKTMAEAYLNCGHKELDKAARDWATKRGYYIEAGSGSHPVSWGHM